MNAADAARNPPPFQRAHVAIAPRGLVALARHHLRHSTVSFEPDPAVLRLAAIYTGIGLDHLGGEEPVALVDERETAETAGALLGFVNDAWNADHFVGAVLTNRRLVVGNLDATSFPLAWIEGARVSSGLLGATVEITGTSSEGVRITKMLDLACAPQLASFLAELARQPHSERSAPSAHPELVTPSLADPTGARRALAEATYQDERTNVILEVVVGAIADGMPVDVGLDLARRTMLFERNERFGRGQARGFWLSPLAAHDFEAVLRLELQACVHRLLRADGVLDLAFRWDSSLARAAESYAVAEASARVFGIGWHDAPQTTMTSVQLADLAPFVGFAARAATGDRFTLSPRQEDLGYLQDLHDAISVHEGRALLLRSLFGWTHQLEVLSGTPRGELERRARQLTRSHDLSCFFAPPPEDG